jgi:hypothetical protein
MAWFGVLSGSILAFLNIYAARLNASAAAIGLLTAGPAVVNLFFSLPAARWLEGRSFIPASFWSSLVQRLGFVVIALLPGLIFVEQVQVAGLIGITLLMSLPGTLLAISFNALLADTIPADFRAEVVGRRNALLAVSMTLSTLVCGQVLDAVVFPRNYQIVFAMGAFGALCSTYHLGRLVPRGSVSDTSWHTTLRLLVPAWKGKPPQAPAEPQHSVAANSGAPASRVQGDTGRDEPAPNAAPAKSGRSMGGSPLHVGLLRGPYGSFMAAYLLFYTCQYLIMPLFPLAFVHTLALSDGMISLGNGLFYGAMFLVSLRLNRMAHRFGHHRLLIAGTMGLSLYPLLIGLARGVPLYLVASLLGGVVWAVLSASLIDRLIERAPEDSRPAAMAFHNLSLNLGILIGSLAGPVMGGWMGLDQAILVGAGLRFLAGVLMIWWG